MDLVDIFNRPKFVQKVSVSTQEKPSNSLGTAGFTYKNIFKTQTTEVYEIHNNNPATVIKFKLFLQSKQKSIKFTLYNLKKMSLELEKKALLKSRSGNFKDSEKFLRRLNNINLQHYTHRLEIATNQGYYNLCWLIDMDLHTPDSYGSTGGKNLLKTIINVIIEQDFSQETSVVSLDNIVNKDWPKLLKNHSSSNQSMLKLLTDDKIKVIYQPRQEQYL